MSNFDPQDSDFEDPVAVFYNTCRLNHHLKRTFNANYNYISSSQCVLNIIRPQDLVGSSLIGCFKIGQPDVILHRMFIKC
jgi:hypothetical protein